MVNKITNIATAFIGFCIGFGFAVLFMSLAFSFARYAITGEPIKVVVTESAETNDR